MTEGKRILIAMLISCISTCICHSDTSGQEEPTVYELEDYIVTGSHFSAEELILDLPITRIDGDSLDTWNDPSAYSALLEQPFSYGYANSDTQSNAGTGSSSANLRGLGNLDTLTLINGRRAGGNSAVGFQHGGFADLNLIPAAAIREIQVAVDGTSVIYGSDGVAGTVNILLHSDYIGNQIDSSYSNTTDGDAAEKRFSFLTGQEIGDSTHIVLMGSWFHRNAILARDRDISKDADFRGQGGSNARSDSFAGRISFDDDGDFTTPGLQLVLDGAPFPGSIADYVAYNRDESGFNFNEFAPAIPELEQRSAMANISHQFSDQLEIWSELLYTETDFSNGLAPAPWQAVFYPSLFGAIFNSPHFPTLPGGSGLADLRYRTLELGNLEGIHEREASRFLLGLRGDIGAWEWETAAMRIENELNVKWSGVADSARLIDSIENTGLFNPFAASFASGTTTTPGGDVDFDNESALLAAATTANEAFDEEFTHFDIKAGGPLFELPAGEVFFLVGAEYRLEKVEVSIDDSINFNEVFLNGANGALGFFSVASPYEAERSVYSVFAESLVPILGDDGSGSSQLDLQFALRFDEYVDESGGLKNEYNELVYKAGFEFEPIPSITLNGSFSTAFRAPTLNESFNNTRSTLTYNVGTEETPDFQQIPTGILANPDLEPEESEIVNFGITFQPDFLNGFGASINYYRIETDGAISTSGRFEDLEPTGLFGSLETARFNTAKVLTDGLEYELTYRRRTPSQSWEASIGLNQILTYEIQPTDDSDTIDFLGRLVHPLVPSTENVQGPGSIPEFKGFARLAWSYRGLTLGGTVNYIHSLEDNPNVSTVGPREIDSWTSLDLIIQYGWQPKGGHWLSGTTLTVGAENVTDEAPPFAAGAFADGYDRSLYSLEGRRVSVSLTKEF